MRNLIRFFCLVTWVLTVSIVLAQNSSDKIIGKWKTIDDETKQAKSIVRIFKTTDGLFFGKIELLLNKPKGEENPDCKHCETYNGKYKTADNKVIGILLLRGLKYDKGDDEWSDGTIFDPNNGKEYYCSLKVKNGNLEVRGSLDPWGLAGRTQTWYAEK